MTTFKALPGNGEAGLRWADPSNPNLTVRLLQQSSGKTAGGFTVANHRTTLILNDVVDISPNGVDVVQETLSVKIILSGSSLSESLLHHYVSSLAGQLTTWRDGSTTPTTYPVLKGFIPSSDPAWSNPV